MTYIFMICYLNNISMNMIGFFKWLVNENVKFWIIFSEMNMIKHLINQLTFFNDIFSQFYVLLSYPQPLMKKWLWKSALCTIFHFDHMILLRTMVAHTWLINIGLATNDVEGKDGELS
jgi:hypothetical protein